jgi:hypothetical protein
MELNGIGLYTLQEAERLTGAQAREVSRWLFGYTFKGGVSALRCGNLNLLISMKR